MSRDVLLLSSLEAEIRGGKKFGVFLNYKVRSTPLVDREAHGFAFTPSRHADF